MNPPDNMLKRSSEIKQGLKEELIEDKIHENPLKCKLSSRGATIPHSTYSERQLEKRPPFSELPINSLMFKFDL
ncbi:hypothetical protein TNCV_1054481 [Trichonephila clavipes]|nr:hypothetical protein TNCV_1054481 [Trichonephila clavipes]